MTINEQRKMLYKALKSLNENCIAEDTLKVSDSVAEESFRELAAVGLVSYNPTNYRV